MVVLPKRRKSKDNPYTIIYCESNQTYIVNFRDSKGVFQNIELTDELYRIFDKFELEDISMMHKVDKYIEHSELFDETLYKRSIKTIISLEEQVEKNMTNAELKKAINKLSEVQKRRIKMYYFEDLTLEEIAEIEECSFQAVSKSINIALQNLKKILKN